MSKIKTAVIGVGSMGRNHARVLYDLPESELVAVCDSDEKTAREISKRYNCNAYTDYKELIEKEMPDAVVIAVPTKLHKKVAVDFMNKGINVLIEKPIASSVEEAEEIIETAEKNKVKLMVGHIERFNPAIMELKKNIDDGKLGKIYKIDVNRVGPFPSRIRDVGVVIDLAVHDIDVIFYLTSSDVERVYAECERRIHTSHEDILSGIMKLKNKTVCSLNINWLTPTKIRKLFVTGEKGMFVANYLTQDLYYYENSSAFEVFQTPGGGWSVNEGKMVKYYIKKEEPLKSELKHFLKSIKQNEKPLISGRDGMRALKIAKALVESSREKSVRNI
ncbi:gfo/Idh/MocA family oxidoreductase [Candidatus Woesearchaeota archaeon]|nr:MAG: gfo/Idh/MocA family oxidoreductase [Candidatus Woesearchaeota archaeon]